MTVVHVLGGVSLVVVVAVSSVLRAGLGVHVAERAATAMVAAGDETVVAPLQMTAPNAAWVPAGSGPLRDRMRP